MVVIFMSKVKIIGAGDLGDRFYIIGSVEDAKPIGFFGIRDNEVVGLYIEEEARKILYGLVMPKHIKNINSTVKFIREEYSKYPHRYDYPISLDYGRERLKKFNSADEEANYYLQERIFEDENDIKTCEFVSIDLPITKTGYIEELFHNFIE